MLTRFLVFAIFQAIDEGIESASSGGIIGLKPGDAS
jgi:hypothetical protein